MVKPQLRSSSRKRVFRRTPGGKTVVHFKEEKPGRPQCGRCGRILGGVDQTTKNIGYSKRIPTRPYAGVLCGDCVDRLIRYETRFLVKYTSPDYRDLELERDLTLERFLPAGWWGKLTSGKLKMMPVKPAKTIEEKPKGEEGQKEVKKGGKAKEKVKEKKTKEKTKEKKGAGEKKAKKKESVKGKKKTKK